MSTSPISSNDEGSREDSISLDSLNPDEVPPLLDAALQMAEWQEVLGAY